MHVVRGILFFSHRARDSSSCTVTLTLDILSPLFLPISHTSLFWNTKEDTSSRPPSIGLTCEEGRDEAKVVWLRVCIYHTGHNNVHCRTCNDIRTSLPYLTMAAPPRTHKLPVQQLVVLSIARFAEPIAMTSVFPYLPEMIESLGVAPNEVAYYAGIAASVFSLSQAVFAVPWGRASDRYGRKPAILACLTGTMIMTFIWGFSHSLAMAIAVRAAQGIFNGNVGIIRTTVAEMVPWKELQPRAFSVMPLVWNIGSVFGPALGGALANPMRRVPNTPPPEHPGLLDLYPYLLPNIVAGVLFLVGITTGILFLDVSNPTIS